MAPKPTGHMIPSTHARREMTSSFISLFYTDPFVVAVVKEGAFAKLSLGFSVVGDSAAPAPSALVADFGSSTLDDDGFNEVPTEGRLAAALRLFV